ncbi:hypothetical protein RBSWK_01878 [Rhodopirellula baltica SWK14]|uniref:Uncharacterized protein n=1 Tax=Rhodopirellula baltica SWK14 TaxID=993516 RepID=L7CK19_RHOBT|nr:hypothetical protein RBSWK_01878 [Rhodopirellula baltica SWK14]
MCRRLRTFEVGDPFRLAAQSSSMVRSLSFDVQAFASPLASADRYYALC